VDWNPIERIEGVRNLKEAVVKEKHLGSSLIALPACNNQHV